jgi:hypothetical protein
MLPQFLKYSLEMEMADPSETSVLTSQTIRSHIPEDNNIHQQGIFSSQYVVLESITVAARSKA